MFNGEYCFYKHGELVGVHKNLITTAGRTHIMRYLAGATPQIGDSISVGIGNNATSLLDTRLGFEVSNQRLDQIGVNPTDPKLVFKTTLLPGLKIEITEVGLWASRLSTGSNSSRTLSHADPATETWLNATWDTGSKLSNESLLLAPASGQIESAQFSTFSQDLSSYTNADEFTVAYEAVQNVASILVYFHTSPQNYYVGTIANLGSGYKIAGVLKNDFVAVGSPDWANISYLRIGAQATGAGEGIAKFDALRIEKNSNLDNSSTLVSRSRLTTPISKAASEPLDIEYTVRFNI